MKIVVLIILIGLLLSCRNSVKKSNADESVQVSANTEQTHDLDNLKINGDLVELPFFEIELELTETAEKKLMDDNESVIVIAYFRSDLDDIDTIPEEYKDRLVRYTITLLTQKIELTDTRSARFENLEFPKHLYDLLEDKDIDVLINVVSGRKSTDVNMLYCAILSGPISKIKEQKFTLNGGLIGERIKTNSIIYRRK